MTRYLAVRALLIIVLGGFASAAFGQAPPINIGESDLQAAALPAGGIKAIGDRVKYCLDKIANEKDPAEVKRAAAALIENGFNRYPDSASFRAAYAKEVGRQVAPLLTKLDDSRSVPLAMSLAQLVDANALPVLEAMVADNSSPPVRFCAWKTLASAAFRSKLTKDQALKLLDLAEKQFKVENSSAVVGQMVLSLRPLPNADKAVVAKSWALVKFAWASIGWAASAGDVEMSHACRTAVSLLETLGKDDKKAPQMLLDMMFFSAKAYGDVKAEGLIADTNAQLLRETEPLLSAISGIQKKFVQDALGIKDAKERASKVKLAVLEDWLDALKAKYKDDIVEPKLPAPASEPASEPAVK